MEVPMLDKDEYAKAHKLYGECMRDIHKEGGRLARFKPLLDYYKEVTGWDETEPNAIMHHRFEQYGPPCENCEKPYRTPQASFCAACGKANIKGLKVNKDLVFIIRFNFSKNRTVNYYHGIIKKLANLENKNMLQYKSEYFKDYYVKNLKYSLFACYKYEIVDIKGNVVTIYTSESVTLVCYSDIVLRIERNRRLFSKPHHYIYDNKSKEQLGVFEFPNWQSANKTQCTLHLNTGEVYSFLQNNDHKRLLKPSTWNRFIFEMTNSNNLISYDGNRKSGSITCTNEANIMLIALGLFIIDEKFRIYDET